MDRSAIRDAVRTFICTELLGRPDYPLGDDEPLVTGGLIDSFSLAYVAVFLETTFDVVIPDADLTTETFDTLSQIVDRVAGG
jgi:acyl carrier protein